MINATLLAVYCCLLLFICYFTATSVATKLLLCSYFFSCFVAASLSGLSFLKFSQKSVIIVDSIVVHDVASWRPGTVLFAPSWCHGAVNMMYYKAAIDRRHDYRATSGDLPGPM